MPLPIAVGGKSISVETSAPVNCREEDSDDGIPLMPVELYQTIGWGICPRNEWQVRVTAGYYDLMDFNKGARDCTMCELRVQVSLLAEPFSNQYRETIYHLKLVDGARDDYPQFQPQVSVSQDRRSLAVLLFHPHQQSSAIVIFQLRKPRADLSTNSNMPMSSMPLPSYCNKAAVKCQAPAVATNPNFVSVWGISAICSIPNVSPPVFLAACNDGSLLWIDARSCTTIATGALAVASKHLPISSLNISAEQIERGWLLAVSSATGCCILARWKLESSTAIQQTQLERNSTGDLKVRSLPTNSDGEQEQTTSVISKVDGESVESHQTSSAKNNSDNDELTSSTTTSNNKNTSLQKTLNKKEENYPGFPRQSSANMEPQDGLQQAFKGLKSNRFWSSMAPKNLNIQAIGSNGGNQHNGTTNGQQHRWKSAFNQISNSPEKETKEMILRKQREKEAVEREARRRKNHMNQFVLQELRKKTMAKSWVKHTSGRGSGTRMSLQRRRRRSDVAGQQEDPLKSTMQVDLLSILEESVVAAQFGKLPTVVCVVYQATRRHPRLAQMFSISETGTFEPITSLNLTLEQIEEADNLHLMDAIVSDEDWDTKNSINTKFGLDLDVDSDTFAISTAFGDHWVGCLWNWRANSLGLVLQNEANSALWSRLYFGKEWQMGLKLCYLESRIQDLQIQSRKHLLPAGVLSPSNSYGINLEACPIFLAADFVAFPYISNETNSGTQQLEWKSSTLPLSYVNAYGAPKVAAVGRHNCSTIAIASSLGVCLLDSRYRWRQFGTPSEESSFSVVSMTWWEGNGTKRSEENEDLLLTIIQLRSGKQYLSCWSPKRLSTSHQLLSLTSPDSGAGTKWGIPLIKNVKATSLTLLSEPSTKSKGAQGSRKGVAVVASTDPDSSELIYATFQLQLTTRNKTGSEKRSISVLAKKVISGILKDGTRSVGPISSIFLAGASFQFDLQNHSATKLLVVTLGVTRSPGGLEVISFDNRNKAYTANVVNADEVSKVSLVDTVHSHTPRVDTLVWAIELLNGEMFCWSVPSLLSATADEGDEFYRLISMERDDILRPPILHAPSLVCKNERRNHIIRYAMGILSNVGASSDWMQQSTSGCQSDVFMGAIPRSPYGCGLRAGQGTKQNRRAGLHITDDDFAVNINISESYRPSNFTITPPAFVPSLYSMFVEIAHRRIRVAEMDDHERSKDCENDEGRILSLERHIHNRLKTSQNKDAVMMALRLFVLLTVQMVADMNKKHEKEKTVASQTLVMVATAILWEIVECVRRCASDLQFASLFLEVGRQMEPSCLPHMFPLPLSARATAANQLSRAGARSVAALFGLCMKEGSLVSSASALPLLGGRTQSRHSCILLMSHAMEALINNTSSNDCRFDRTEEERSVIGDIFRFGIKLEDAAKFAGDCNKNEIEKEKDCKISQLSSPNKETVNGNHLFLSENESKDSLSDFSDDSSRGSDKQQLLCSTEARSNVMNVLSMFDHKSREEQEIRKSALNFIGVTSESQVDSLNIDGEKTNGQELHHVSDHNMVGGLVGSVLVELILSPKTDCPWKAMASIARILAHENCDQGITCFSEIAGSLTGVQVDNLIPDLHPDLRAGDVMDRFTEFLVTETGYCGNEIDVQGANLIVNLVLILFQCLEGVRLPQDQSSVPPGLVIVGLVASCVAGREQQLLSTIPDDCFLSECYKVTAYDC